VKVQSAHAFYTQLAKALESSPITKEEARAVASAVEGLAPDAPLTLETIDQLGLSAGLRANLIFAWLNHRYPEQVGGQLEVAHTLAGVLRRLIGDAEGIPAFAAEFHQTLLRAPRAPKPSEVRALDVVLSNAIVSFAADAGGKVVFKADDLSARGEWVSELFDPTGKESSSFAVSQGSDGMWRAQWNALDGSPKEVRLEALDPASLLALEGTLARAAKLGLLKATAGSLRKALPPLREAHAPKVHPGVARVEALLRLELGVERVGETKLETLNGLIAAALAAAQAAREEPSNGGALDGLFPRSAGPEGGPGAASGGIPTVAETPNLDAVTASLNEISRLITEAAATRRR
jgi:hypothetical protein